jgi:hypothetical protein
MKIRVEIEIASSGRVERRETLVRIILFQHHDEPAENIGLAHASRKESLFGYVGPLSVTFHIVF